MLRYALMEQPLTQDDIHAQARMKQMHDLIELMTGWLADVQNSAKSQRDTHHSLPLAPMARNVSSSKAVAIERALATFSTVGATHHPHPRAGNKGHGVPVVVITGREWAIASAMAMPKFSV